MKKNIWFISVTVIMIVALISGCAKSTSQPTEQPKSAGQSQQTPAAASDNAKKTDNKKVKLGVSVITAQHAFYVDVMNGMKQEAAAKGADINILDGNSDLTKQSNQIRDFIQQKVDSIILYGVDPKAIVPVAEEAINAGIPVVTADMKLETDKVATFIGTDNKVAGKIAGDYAVKYIKEKLGGKANVGILLWKSSVAQQDRMNGFVEGLKALPDVKVVAELPGNDRATSLSSTQSMLQAHPDLDLIFTTNEGGALGAVSAMEMQSNKKVALIGFDISKELAAAIDGGKLLATVAQQPVLMGKMTVDAAFDVIGGKKLDAFTPLPAKLVTKDNVAEFK